MINLNGQTALVCGSTQGIGLATAKAMQAAGASLILVARNEQKLKSVIESFGPNTEKHEYIVADFSVESTIMDLCQIIQNKKIDILVNNTGGPPSGLIQAASIASFRQAFEAHLVNNHYITTSLIPGMKDRRYGRIINIISTSVKQPLPNLGVSNTIRAAVANWAKTMANELASYGITVNNVLPGATSTPRLEQIIQNKATQKNIQNDTIAEEMKMEIPMQRFADASEIAYGVLFLASPLASYITGINLPIDGGRTTSL